MKKPIIASILLIASTHTTASILPNENTNPLERGTVILPKPKSTIDVTTTSIKRGGGNFPVIKRGGGNFPVIKRGGGNFPVIKRGGGNFPVIRPR